MEARCFACLEVPPNPMAQLTPIGVPVELRETRFPWPLPGGAMKVASGGRRAKAGEPLAGSFYPGAFAHNDSAVSHYD